VGGPLLGDALRGRPDSPELARADALERVRAQAAAFVRICRRVPA
jgi:hypothetical protein